MSGRLRFVHGNREVPAGTGGSNACTKGDLASQLYETV